MPIAKCNPKKSPANSTESHWKKWFCTAMWTWMSMDGERGMTMYVLTKLWGENAGEKNLAGIVYRKSTARDANGIMLSNCPFCGVSYKAWLKPHLKKQKPAKALQKSR